MKEKILDYYLNSPNVRKLKDLLDANVHISCLGLIGSSRAYVVAAASEIEGGHSFVICGDKEKAAYFYNDLENIYGRVKNYHIAVKEVGKNVIFLRKLAEGGVAHSFGLHVARMAGMPKQVLESAEKTLAALEKGDDSGKILRCSQNDNGVIPSEVEGSRTKKNTVKPYNIKEGRVESDGSIQLSFFQLEDPLLSSLKEELDNADLNNMTPLQAFDLLRSMKEQLGI